MRIRQRKRRVSSFLTGFCIAVTSVIGLAGTAEAQQPYGTKIIAASDWLGGSGVDVYANGSPYYVSNDYSAPAVGMKWQCVELPQRLYKAKGWHSGFFTGVNQAFEIYDKAGNLGMTRQANGSITSIVPGDMIIHDSRLNGAGHVAVVDSVVGTTVNAVEQNGSHSGRATYTWASGSLTRGDTPYIGGVVHDPNNLYTGAPAPSDLDSDGILDAVDWCPYVKGLAINNGCPRHYSQKMTADFNKDGRSDTVAFFNYGNGHLALFSWNGRSDGQLDWPVIRWQDFAGWEAIRVIPIGTGDFDGDSNQDIASFYDYGGGSLGLFVWYGNGDGSFAPGSRRWYTTNGWDAARMIPGGVGDFNGDGRADIASFFYYGGGHTGLFTWNGRTDRSFDWPVLRWQDLAGWEATRLTAGVTGDFNGDGNQDIASFYNYGGGSSGIFVWSGAGNGVINSPTRYWYTASGWESTRITPSGAADFNKDGRADIAAFFNYGGGHVAMFTWSGAPGSFGWPVMRWQDLAGWEAYRISPVGTGDFNGDGNQDMSAFYNYGGASLGIFGWKSNGDGTFAIHTRPWYTANGWDGSRIIV
ncbi:MAG TPA: FG-GAP-like repeat-containing protein [Candidatus Saccharimonadales bacterium]|nr:FG-GAP-like repeat-containing protein [Candidatus Saccharimonadales bacterium]